MDNQNSEHEKTLLGTLLHCLLVTASLFFCVYLWNTFFASSRVPATIAPTQNVSTVQNVKPKYKHTRIADIKVGERVVTSTNDTSQPTQVDSATWKKVTLYAEETWYDGTVDTINVVTLVPPEWIALHDAKVGSLVPIPLDLQEMGLDENLLAKIQAIERCPEIRAGPGRVVLTTVNHLSQGVCNLMYTNCAGQSETIRPTASHRFYSLDRNDWIHIGDARFGEKLQGLGNDVITVVSCQPLGTTERVYNMTVEDEHVYHVGYLNLLAHNNWCGVSRRDAFRQAKQDAGIPMNQQPEMIPELTLTEAPSRGGHKIIDPQTGQIIPTRAYLFTDTNGNKKILLEHSFGHTGVTGSHFQVHDYDLHIPGPGHYDRTKRATGTADHYFFPGTYNPFSE
jgi:hypothetical protein